MSVGKIVIANILRCLWKKGRTVSSAAKEIIDVEGAVTVIERVAQNCFRRFKKGEIRARRLSVFEDEALLEIIKQHLGTSTYTLLAEPSSSKSTVNRQHHKLSLVNKRRGEGF